MKILNLYSGIGGNRKLWGNEHDITAIEIDEETAKVYQENFHNDKVIITDAHEYLLKNYMNYDFIWSSPPCPSHSRLNTTGLRKREYPDMKLYEEIIFLKHFYKGLFVVENVIPYYKYLIQPTKILERHPFWSNFPIFNYESFEKNVKIENITGGMTHFDFNIKGTDIKNKRKALRNCVNPKLGKHILNCALNGENIFENQPTLF